MAGPSVNVKIEIDARKLLKWLDDSPDRLRTAIGNILQKASFSVERESKKVTPVDTGRLRASIATELIPMQATIAPNTNYAVFVHEGTRYMSPRPFMYEGLDSAERDFDSIVDAELSRI